MIDDIVSAIDAMLGGTQLRKSHRLATFKSLKKLFVVLSQFKFSNKEVAL